MLYSNVEKIFSAIFSMNFLNAFARMCRLFFFMFTPNKKFIYLLRNMDSNAWSTENGPGKNTSNGPRNNIFY